MKRTIFVLIMVISIILVGCHSEMEVNEFGHDKFIYRMATGEPLEWNTSFGMPIKINLVSGKTTPVCIDPLCMHDDDECPFFECFGCAVDGNILFFRRGWISRTEIGFEGTEKLCTYDAATGKVQVLSEYSDEIIFAGIHDNQFYYYLAEFSFEGDVPSCVYKLHCADGDTGKITELPLDREYTTTGGFTSNSDYPNLLSFGEDCIYWMEYDESGSMVYYMTDLSYQNKQMLADGGILGQVFHNGWAYSVKGVSELLDPNAGRTPENMKNTYTISRTSLNDQTQETVAEGLLTSNFIITDRYLYAMAGISSEQKGSTEILHGCRIYRMNHDGSERLTIAEHEQYDFMYQQFSNNGVFVDAYEDTDTAYLALAFCEPDENGKMGYSSDTLILNTVTGQFTVSEYVE